MFAPGYRRKRYKYTVSENQESPLSIWTSIHRRCRRCPYYQYYILFTMIFLISIMIKTKHGSIDYRSVPRPARPKPGAKAGLMDPTSYMKKVRAQDVGPIFIPDNLKSEDSKWDYRLDAKASDSVPLNRFVLDYRHPKCRSVVYDEARMPNMTIIIPFYNEVASLVLRTIYAVLMRTPYHLIAEIILVDDKSNLPNLKEKFEEYATAIDPKVRMLHNAKREGLIRSRQRAAEVARGEVLVFLDSQTEPTFGWYQPLLAELMAHPHTVLQPAALNTNKDSMEIGAGKELKDLWEYSQMRTFFTWDLRVLWLPQPEEDKNKPPEKPYKISALVGCFIIIRRDYFFHLGGFDTALDLWGGENIELAFQAWMCGGRAMTVPCSKISHVFRKLPYIDEASVEGEDSQPIRRNLARIAEVWMDEYKELFYKSKHHANNVGPSILTEEDWKDISKRRRLRESLQCRSFKFLLENVIADVPVPPLDVRYFGNIRDPGQQNPTACIAMSDFLSPFPGVPYPAFILNTCRGRAMFPPQAFYISSDGKFVHTKSSACLSGEGPTKFLSVDKCNNGKRRKGWWEVRPILGQSANKTMDSFSKLIIYTDGTRERCLTRSTNHQMMRDDSMQFFAIFLQPCEPTMTKTQAWMFSYIFGES